MVCPNTLDDSVTQTNTHKHMHIYKYGVHMFIYIDICIVCICIYIYISVCVYVYVCVYTYIIHIIVQTIPSKITCKCIKHRLLPVWFLPGDLQLPGPGFEPWDPGVDRTAVQHGSSTGSLSFPSCRWLLMIKSLLITLNHN